MTLLDPILDQLVKLWARTDRMPVVRWGTVTGVSPLRVMLDGDAAALPFAPACPVRNLTVGQRVVCVEQHRRVIVIQANGNSSPFAMAAGEVVVTPTAANTPTPVTVTLPVGRFTLPPTITATAVSIVPGTVVTGVGIGDRLATSFVLWLTRTNTTQTRMAWQAVQMGSGSASG